MNHALRTSVDIDAPPSVVWDVLVDWERQPDWMVDAKEVHVVTPHREGEGVTIRAGDVSIEAGSIMTADGQGYAGGVGDDVPAVGFFGINLGLGVRF